MSDILPMVSDAAERLFASLGERRAEPFEALWPLVAEAGFPALLSSEAEGGFGGDWRDAFAVARLAGAGALALPVVEAIVAGAVGAQPDETLMVIAPRCEGRLENGRFTGRLSGVPWGRHATTIWAVCADGTIGLRADAAASLARRTNPAGEPRDTLTFHGAIADTGSAKGGPPDLFEFGALMRAAQIAGALDAALGQSVDHANQRSQFGRPIGKFQALQQSLASFAEEAAAANCAGQAAAEAADRGGAGLEIAAAKLRANMAAGVGVACAHQAHGAIGFTQDCLLHLLTRRLTSWRSEFGADREWAEKLGAIVAAIGAEGLWPELTRRTDPG
jgi:acyl-CoA dehydrogenase